MIFEDYSQKRWKRAKLAFICTIVALAIPLGGVIAGLIVNPPLASVRERQDDVKKAANIKADILASDRRPGRLSRKPASTPVLDSATSSSGRLLSAAFLQQDDQNGLQSLKEHGSSTDLVFPDWYYLDSSDCTVQDKRDAAVAAQIASSTGAAILPRYTDGDNDHWYGKEAGLMLHDPKASACVAAKLADLIDTSGAAGINVDLEDLDADDKDVYLDFLSALGADLHKSGKLLTVDVTAGDPAYDLEYIGRISDYVVLMAYDEHYPGGTPGPIASTDWFEDTVDNGVQSVPKEKLIVALGAYGYDWTLGTTTPATSLSFNDTLRLAADSGAQPELNSDSGFNTYFSYTDAASSSHKVWLLDGLSAWNEYLKVKDSQAAGVALWRLGTEDQNYWKIFDSRTTGASFKNAPRLGSISLDDESELFDLRYDRNPGNLDITTDTDGSIDYGLYKTLPTGYDLAAIGRAIPDKELLLTFDDGPDETWTPQILEVLKENQVSGTFFLVGDQVQRFPETVEQEVKAGVMFGNHTYLHPDVSAISSRRLEMELDQTQRIIEAETGRRTVLFRPPYDTDSTPDRPEEIRPIATAKKLGYIIAGANIDSEDWQHPGVQAIIDNVQKGLKDKGNHVIVMHDAGGDRSQTVAALRILIPELKRQGYTFVTFDQAVGLSRDQLNPPLSGQERFFVEATAIWNGFLRYGWMFISWLFIFTTIIAAARILFLGTMVIRSTKHYRRRASGRISEPATVIVPCYNEEKTVAYTLAALQKSTKKDLEILVVNDGSSDETSAVVRKFMAEDGRIRLIEKKNGGKSSALNIGFQEARSDLIVTIDGDTILLPDTVDELTKPFADPRVDAVCGNVEVGNVCNILTGFQALEYITSQNFDRRAFDELNCISVVPGATGAWRKDKVLAVGGYGSDTLTEDADLTLRLLAAGGVIVYAPEARSRTEAPETVKGLAKQRFRWSYGTYQCLWKNRKLLFHGSLGWIALPNMLFFQIIFPILSPIGDLVFFISIFRGDFGAIASGYVMFTIMDLAGSILAFSLEKKPKKLMWLILIQRFFYRQFMYVITYKSIIAIIKGRRHGWNKIARTGHAGTGE